MVCMVTTVKILELGAVSQVSLKRGPCVFLQGKRAINTYSYAIKCTSTLLSNGHVVYSCSGVMYLKPVKHNIGASNQIIYSLCNFTCITGKMMQAPS